MQILAGLSGLTIKQATNKRAKEKSRYRGVEVIANGKDCCEAVREISGKRFLSEEVPKLPLIGCDATECRCSYELFEDRRTDLRRASDATCDIASQFHRSDHRSGRSSGRRSEDR